MVVENSWAEVGEVTETPVGMHTLPSTTASESLSLFSTPPYPTISEDLSSLQHDRVPLKSETNVSGSTSSSDDQEESAVGWKNVDDAGVRGPVFNPLLVFPLMPLPQSPAFEEDEDVSMCLPLGFASTDRGPFGELFSSENETQEDVKDSSAVPGVCGLRNLGNTCFMSAGLQCLSNTPTLLQFFVSHLPLKKVPSDSLTAQFAALLHRMWSGENKIVHPVEFKHSLGISFPQFKDYRQHDCQEFLALLLDSLHVQLNTANIPHLDQAQSSDRVSNSSLSHSSENSADTQLTFRVQPMPDHVAPFRLAELHSGTNNQALNYSCKVEKNELAVHLNTAASSAHLNGLQDILKDAKTSNVNVLVEEQEVNNTICFDSDKFPRYESAKVRDLVNSNLLDMYDFDNKSVSVKRIKDTNLSLEQSEGEKGESGGLDLKRIKLTEQNNCKQERNNIMFEDNDSLCCNIDSLKQTNNDLLLAFKNGVNKDPDHEISAPSSTSGLPTDADECLTLESFPDNCDAPCTADCDASVDLSIDTLADEHWEKHLAVNQSTVIDTFLGQFKSTVVCSECKHVSVTYEPFMYLSVPLPHAMERQICVTYIPMECDSAVQILVTLNKQDKVRHLRENVIQLRIKEECPLNDDVTVVLAEVLDHHIAKILDDVTPLRHVNDVSRSIYALEVLSPPSWYQKSNPPTCESAESSDTGDVDVSNFPVQSCEPPPYSVDVEGGETEGIDDKLTADSAGVSDHEVTSSDDEDLADKCGSPIIELNPSCSVYVHDNSSRVSDSEMGNDTILGCDRGDDWKSCAICLEDMNKDMRRHIGCECVLCEGCIENACKHNGSSDEMPCPMCNKVVKPNIEFVRIDKFISTKPTIRLLNVPVVFRFDTEGDGNNNQKSFKLFGHPNVLRLPSVMPASELASIIKRLVCSDKNYTVLTVDGVGYHCSRCLYTKHCRGCPVPTDGEVVLRSADTLAIRFMESFKQSQSIQHSSMKEMRSVEPLSLYDCLKAFSESELLDEHNPWYCPTCQKNRCATKTLSVCRYPDFLIVYLKRFVFHNGMSTKLDNKVTYPLNGLMVNSPSSLRSGSPHVYNLYACVCHYGGVSAGHYTAYAKNPFNSEWHYFNDETVSRQRPQEDDFSNGYILFYQKQGLAFPDLNVEEPLKPNIDHLIERLYSTMDQDAHQDSS